MTEQELREQMVVQGASLFERGLTAGSSGNLSVKLPDGMLITPTNSCLGRLDADRISRLDAAGNLLSGDKPSKEVVLHRAMYRARPAAAAVVHLHPTYSVAVSCMDGLDEDDVLPPITAYYVMRIGTLPLVPYFPPGDTQLATAVERTARSAHAVLMSNHGPVVSGRTLDAAVIATEELEETARLFLLLRNEQTRTLTHEQVADLQARFPD